eukprot:CAMPEP_0119480072 /NCGR_PEP_ID=MMETSP1344-20130328/9051_1 /TAXON_ID=236787 /ORGANISM="Florenciella parvula, Strain CCMP2471" /LENGTH=82 /DNA_ID=CAMNT_0007514353 /DNA_START=65 /DNA_END=313 /DNA_ORIENTATION=+
MAEQPSPQQMQAAMQMAQQQMAQQQTAKQLEKVIEKCFNKCAGKSGDRLDKKEQLCVGSCFDVYFDTNKAVTEALVARQQKS